MTSEDLPPELDALPAPLTEPTPSNEAAAFARAVDDLQHTLTLLTVKDWGLPAVNDLTVGELAGHLIGTQIAMAAELGLEGAPVNDSTDHIEATRASITDASALTPGEAAAEFDRVSRVLTDHLAQLDESGLAATARFGPITADVKFLLLGRVFELWTHDNDLRRAVGLGRVEPDQDRLWMMTRAVMPLVRLIGDERIRIVLTGAGGGVWPAQGDEIAEIAVDATAFCRRVANRLPIERLHADIKGDVATANDTLGALAGLALD